MQAVQPSTTDKLKMGAIMGSAAGLGIGFLFGGMAVLRYGPGPRGFLRTLGQYMLTSAATFGFFMSIGSVIRNEDIPQLGYKGSDWSPKLMQQRSIYDRILAESSRREKIASNASKSE
ncbi:membrane protein Mgr2 [Schizosaccharomyces octosporus yFS286]|uniref:Membrane protein Mgr2 n=1 Tax=Schizosaccharomyces octosporus (strain yFS286) TaxID=483514 RepID=S9PXQ6_SCHOY|nr:membrane protein Mgr2 [Schizosaccharomyces octosporus yFS286]EPX72248.1 membrane protein Mgr2 [Schizosaccharomyces octosporus yFS286]